ncbi:hypothetical protein D3C80_2094200 [compost metagenome]
MFGSLMMLASACKVFLPSSARVLGARCSGVSDSGNSPSTRAATEMSLSVTLMPAGAANVRMMGKKEAVARRGASSVRV